MFVTLSGIVIFVKLLQFSKAYCPILVTLSDIIIFVKLLQPEKALFPIIPPPLIIT